MTKRSKSNPETDLARLLDKAPPQSYEAECALLGGLILDGQVIGEVVQILDSADDFYRPAHAAIYQTLVHLYDENKPVDMVHLKQTLEDRQELEQVGGVEYLLMLAESVPSAVACPHYARVVRDKARLRQLVRVHSEALTSIYSAGDRSAADHLESVEAELFRLSDHGQGGGEFSNARVVMQDVYESLSGKSQDGVPTGYYELDDMLSPGGLAPGELIILAARPSMGKTACALGILDNVAIKSNTPAALFSLEMGKRSIGERLVGARTRIESMRIRRRTLEERHFTQLFEAAAAIGEAPLYIDDRPGMSLMQIRATARRLVSKHDVRLIVIDYLQLLNAPGAESRQQEVATISRGLKELARELDVPIVVLSQLNRANESRQDRRPRMSDIRESGSIEQDADVIMMLHREEYYHKAEPGWKDKHPDQAGAAELIIEKQRNGPTGTVRLKWIEHCSAFVNPSTEQPNLYGSGAA